MGTTTTPSHEGFRFPAEIISHAIWLYHRFLLSYRDVEELLAERGMVATYETMRQWSLRFGQAYASQLRRRRSQPEEKWFLDEVFLKISGKTQYLWRMVDQDGQVLAFLVQRRRNTAAGARWAKKCFTPSGYPNCSRAARTCHA